MEISSGQLPDRKNEHIRINLEEDVRSGLTTGFEKYSFVNNALPEIDLDQVDTSTRLFGKDLRLPLLISSMTGGTEKAFQINSRLAQAAQETHIAIGLGSQRAAIEKPELRRTFQVRGLAPDVLLFANLGAVQLNYGYGIDQCRTAVDMAEADGLILHLNALQEALQPEGNTRFKGLLKAIEEVCKSITVPVIVKEVGWGISPSTARRLVDAGVSAIDVAGAGGTSWSQVEMHRIADSHRAKVAAAFMDWGIPTVEALKGVVSELPGLPVFATGGLRNGIDLAKALAMGASIGGMAGPFLKAAAVSAGEVAATIGEIHLALRVAMFACGAGNITEIKKGLLVERQ